MLKFYLLAAFVQIIWSFTPTASAIILQYLPVEGYVALRYTISGGIFLLITLVTKPKIDFRLGDLPLLLALGGCSFALSSLGALYGLKLGGVITLALASSFSPVLTAFCALVILKERVNGFFPLALLLFAIGALCLLVGKYAISDLRVALGSLVLILASYGCEAVGFVTSKRLKARYPLVAYLAFLQLSGAAIMWVVCLAIDRAPTGFAEFPPIAWVSLVYVVLVAAVFCFFTIYWLLNFVEGHRLAFFEVFHSIFSVILGRLFFAEAVHPLMLTGGVFLLASLVLVQRR